MHKPLITGLTCGLIFATFPTAASAQALSAGAAITGKVVTEVVDRLAPKEVIATQEPWWRAITLAQAGDIADNLVNSIDLLESLSQSNSFTRGLYTSLSFLAASPELTDLAFEVEYYTSGYKDLFDYYLRFYESGYMDYHSYSTLIHQTIPLVDKSLKDIKFIYDYILSPKEHLTQAERRQMLNEYIQRLAKRRLGLNVYFERKRDTLRLYYGAQAADAIFSESSNVGIMGEFSNLSREDYKTIFDKEINQSMYASNASSPAASSGSRSHSSSTGVYSIEEGAKVMTKQHSKITLFASIIIALLTALYIPYNIWRVNSHERQSNDALIRIIIGLMFGFLGILFLNSVITTVDRNLPAVYTTNSK